MSKQFFKTDELVDAYVAERIRNTIELCAQVAENFLTDDPWDRARIAAAIRAMKDS